MNRIRTDRAEALIVRFLVLLEEPIFLRRGNHPNQMDKESNDDRDGHADGDILEKLPWEILVHDHTGGPERRDECRINERRVRAPFFFMTNQAATSSIGMRNASLREATFSECSLFKRWYSSLAGLRLSSICVLSSSLCC